MQSFQYSPILVKHGYLPRYLLPFFFFFFLHIVVARSAARDEGHDWMASAQILSDNMDRRVAGQVLIS